METNPLTGYAKPYLYRVDIYNGRKIITSITIRTTSEEEAVAQAVKLLKTVVTKLNNA